MRKTKVNIMLEKLFELLAKQSTCEGCDANCYLGVMPTLFGYYPTCNCTADKSVMYRTKEEALKAAYESAKKCHKYSVPPKTK